MNLSSSESTLRVESSTTTPKLTFEQRGILIDVAVEFLSKIPANTSTADDGDDNCLDDDQRRLMMEGIIDDAFNNSKQVVDDKCAVSSSSSSCERINTSLNQCNQELSTASFTSSNLNKSMEGKIESENYDDGNGEDNTVTELQMDVVNINNNNIDDDENDMTEQQEGDGQSLTVGVENQINVQQQDNPLDEELSYKETDATVQEDGKETNNQMDTIEENEITERQNGQDLVNILGIREVKSNDPAIEQLNGESAEESKKRKQSSGEPLENNLPKQRKIEMDKKDEKSIGQFLKPDKRAAKYFVQLLGIKKDELEEKIAENEKKFGIGCVNTVLSYLNNYMNGIPEDENINMEEYANYTDDNLRVWHAERIGSGSFGNVLKVIKRNKDTLLIESVRAIKVIPNSVIGASEAIIGAKLNHANVVTVYNLLVIRYICCIEMEYVERGSLADLIKTNTKLFKDVVKNMLFQCFEVLLLMKQQGMVHSDIKPGNILVRENNDILIADFGMTLNGQTISTQTRGGTIRYCAPELKVKIGEEYHLRSGGVPDFSSDLYSLGLTFHELTGNSLRDETLKNCIDNLKSEDCGVRKKAFYQFAFYMFTFVERKSSAVWKKDEEMMAYLKEHKKTFLLEEVRSTKDLDILKQTGEPFLKDKKFVLELLTAIGDWSVLENVESFWNDKDVVLAAIKVSRDTGRAVEDVIELANDSLFADREFILEAIAETDDDESIAYIIDNFTDPSLRDNKDFLDEIIDTFGRKFLKFVKCEMIDGYELNSEEEQDSEDEEDREFIDDSFVD